MISLLARPLRPSGNHARAMTTRAERRNGKRAGAELREIDVASTHEDRGESSAGSGPASRDQRGVTSAGAMQSCRRVTWAQRGLLIGVVASALVVVTDVVPRSLTTSTAPSVLLW